MGWLITGSVHDAERYVEALALIDTTQNVKLPQSLIL